MEGGNDNGGDVNPSMKQKRITNTRNNIFEFEFSKVCFELRAFPFPMQYNLAILNFCMARSHLQLKRFNCRLRNVAVTVNGVCEAEQWKQGKNEQLN